MKNLVIFIFFILFFSGCFGEKIAQVKENERVKDINSFFEIIQKKRLDTPKVIAEAGVDTFQKGERVRGIFMLMTERPSSFRLDTISPFEQPISTLIINNSDISFYEFDKNRCYFGEATKDNLIKFLPMELTPFQIIDLFSGIAPMIVYENYKFEYDEKEAQYKITLQNGDQKETISYIATTFQIKKITLFNKNKKTIEITFDEFTSKYAKKIVFEDFKNDIKIKIKIKSFETPESIESKNFILQKGSCKEENL
jgi:outer membrane lipoprotein-sorting protein